MEKEDRILGLDIGSNSVRSALVAFQKRAAVQIVRAGVRCFEQCAMK